MAKLSMLGRLRQLRVVTCGCYVLGLITLIQFFSTYGTYNYSAVPLSALDKELYKEISSNLVLKKGIPACSIEEILRRTNSLESWEIPNKFDDFSPAGIVNGSYVPTSCNPQFSVAVLVTYRNRQSQLDVFLPYMHNFLRRQNIHYKIYVIEQQDEKPWNKGLLYNIGAKIALAEKFPCLILHDVDLLPLDAGNLYACFMQPRHLSASIDKMRFVLTYPQLVGGVLAVRADHYTALNGLSNRFQRWGGEDDDFYARIKEYGLEVLRAPREVSRYCMRPHAPEPASRDAWRVLADNRRARGGGGGGGSGGEDAAAADGLRRTPYEAMRVRPHRLFTLVGVKL